MTRTQLVILDLQLILVKQLHLGVIPIIIFCDERVLTLLEEILHFSYIRVNI